MAKGIAAGRDAAPRRQQPHDHRQHSHAQGQKACSRKRPRAGILQDAHKRVLSVAAVQDHLRLVAGQIGFIEHRGLRSRQDSCEALTDSVIGESRPIALKIECAEGQVTSRQAVSLGLDRALSSMPPSRSGTRFLPPRGAGQIVVAFEIAGTNWKLSIADNGIGVPGDGAAPSKQKKSGLGCQHRQGARAVTGGPGSGTSRAVKTGRPYRLTQRKCCGYSLVRQGSLRTGASPVPPARTGKFAGPYLGITASTSARTVTRPSRRHSRRPRERARCSADRSAPRSTVSCAPPADRCSR